MVLIFEHRYVGKVPWNLVTQRAHIRKIRVGRVTHRRKIKNKMKMNFLVELVYFWKRVVERWLHWKDNATKRYPTGYKQLWHWLVNTLTRTHFYLHFFSLYHKLFILLHNKPVTTSITFSYLYHTEILYVSIPRYETAYQIF